MTTNAVESVGDGKDSQLIRPVRGGRKARSRASNEAEGQRFFLAKPGGNNRIPDLGKEFATEPEAIVESLKTGLNYFSIAEWRGIADFSGKKPLLEREAVRGIQKPG
jgi:hypothetical protein